MSEHQPWSHDPDADPQAERPRGDGERADALDPDALDADAVGDLDVHEDAESVAGGRRIIWEEEGQPQIE